MFILVVLCSAPAVALPAWYSDDLQRELPPFSEEQLEQIRVQCGGAPNGGQDGDPVDLGDDDDHPNPSTDGSATVADQAEEPPSDTDGHDENPANLSGDDPDAYDSQDSDPYGQGDGEYGEDDVYDDYDENAPDGDDGTNAEPYDEDGDDKYIARVGIEGPRPPDFDQEPPDWWKDFVEWLSSFEAPDTGVDLADVLKTIGIVALCALVLALLGMVFRIVRRVELPERQQDATNALEALRQITGSRAHSTWADDGDFATAIHALLLDALVKLSSRFEIIESPSSTSREVAEVVEPQGGPLTSLVRISEACIFSLTPANQALYEHAVALHRQIVEGTR